MGFIAMLVFIAISAVMILSGMIKMPDAQGQQQRYRTVTTHAPTTAQVSANVVLFPPADPPPPYVH